ncbi:MAG: peptidylprolyl isomerase [Nitrospinae bacterium]|nr:peptidylprolyl isomerase [Nitrospinota bacterium]
MKPAPRLRIPSTSGTTQAPLIWFSLVLLLNLSTASALVIDRIIARVNEEVITLSQLQEEGLPFFERLRESFSGEELARQVSLAEREFLDQLILKRLQLQYAAQIGLTASENDVNAAVKDVLTRNNLTQETLVEMLAKEGLTLQDYKDRVREQIVLARLLNQAVRSRVSVDASEIDAYYQAHREEFGRPDEARVRHIFFRLDPAADKSQQDAIYARAARVLQEARNDGNFEALARHYSEDGTAATGGDLGVMKRGQMLAGFEEVVFSLRDSEISDIVRTPNGLHIVKAEAIDKGMPRSFAEVKEEVQRRVLQEKTDKRLREWTNELRNKAYIEINLYDGEK